MNLNSRYHKNSTVLNNIGQAWFGLGDMVKAGRYLDSAILIYTYHSQANYTKYLIEESKGNTAGAIEALLRSIRKSYSATKEGKLRKHGKKLTGKDVVFPFSMPQDPLGLQKFDWPAYPQNVNESKIQEEMWSFFIEKCAAELRQLNSKSAQLEKIAMDATQKRTTALIQAATSGKVVSAMPWYAPIAALKLTYLVEDNDGGLEFRMEKNGKKVTEALLYDAELQKTKQAAEDQVSRD